MNPPRTTVSPTESTVSPFHIFHRWTKWEDFGECRTSQQINPLTGLAVDDPYITAQYMLQLRRCTICNAADHRRTKL